MKNILILSGSPRKGGNSDTLCDQFMAGAQEAGHNVEKIWVQGEKIAPCLGCGHCQSHAGVCVQKDAMADILQKMVDTEGGKFKIAPWDYRYYAEKVRKATTQNN